MDSVTQIALGAAVGEAVLGRYVGRKAALWGAVCGTLPDLDILIPMGSDVANFTYHRSFSHSILCLSLLTPAMVWVIAKFGHVSSEHHARWYHLVFWVFMTHILLDCFTVYGTQIFWPFVTTPMAWGTIFIIDPLFTLPLLLGLVSVWQLREHQKWALKVNAICICVSVSYLAWSAWAKVMVTEVVRNHLDTISMNYNQLAVMPSPFNTLLWRILIMNNDGYYEGWYSVLNSGVPIELTQYSHQHHLIDGLVSHWPVARLQWFTKGFYRVRQVNDEIIMTDLRMGLEDAYVFNFKVADIKKDLIVPSNGEIRTARAGWDRWDELWQRLFH